MHSIETLKGTGRVTKWIIFLHSLRINMHAVQTRFNSLIQHNHGLIKPCHILFLS